MPELENLDVMENVVDNTINDIWGSSTFAFTHNLFGGYSELFYLFFVAVTAISTFAKTKSFGSTFAVLLMAGSLLSFLFVELNVAYYLLIATGGTLAGVLYYFID